MAVRPASDCDLTGIGVLVTRAIHQAGPLCDLIQAQGGRPQLLPALEICDPLDPAPVKNLLAQLDRFDIAIFISPNAVTHGLALLPSHALPPGLKIGAVGAGTARALQYAGVETHILPEGRFDSEALLETPALQQVTGQRIIIFRGEGGRPLLGDSLQQRDAEVVYAEVYRRVRPETDVSELLSHWPSDVQIITTTSIDILNNLSQMLGEEGASQLQTTPLVVISERMCIRAQELGCKQVVLAHGADDQAILEALCRWVTTH
jgi:uroporphyrinogen-III synthase